MQKIFLFTSLFALVLSCNNAKKTAATPGTDATSTTTAVVDLPYKASYASNFTTDVPDADLKMVLTSYKDWADGNIAALENVMSDSVQYDGNDGSSMKLPKAGLAKLWATYRDSLSSVSIEMHAWHKMYAPDKKEGHIVTWYKEIDTYKNGKIDSATYHDINRVENGKITWFSSMKRGFKKQE